jgi:hypothetical protein
MIELKPHPSIKDRWECSQCGFNYYPNQKIIEKIYVWMSVDRVTNCEGMIAIPSGPLGTTMIAASSDLELCLKLEPLIRRAVKPMSMTSKLIEFRRARVIKEII